MKTHRSVQLKEAWIIFFTLGIIMLNYPFLHIFNKTVLVFGIPLIVLYFLIGWPVSIFVIYLFSRGISLEEETEAEQYPEEEEQRSHR